MDLLIDIGNTNSTLAFYRGKSQKKKYFIRTSREEVEPVKLRRLFGKNAGKIDKVIVVSVVPRFLSVVKKSLKKVLPECPFLVVGKDITVPIKVKYRDPEEVGQDRLVASYAAKILSGSPVLVIDFGTAVTFDFVNSKGEYDGGLIFPGLRVSLKSLVENAALLPDIDIKLPRGIIGKDTRSSMNKGIIYGYADMCDGVIKRFRDKYGSMKVIATGGDASLIASRSSYIKRVYDNLIFTGLSDLSSQMKREPAS